MRRSDFDLDEAVQAALTETLLDGIIATDAQGCIVEFNTMAEQMLGYQQDFALGKPLIDLIIPPARHEQFRSQIPSFDAERGGILHKRFQTFARRADRREFPVELTIAPTRIHRHPYLLFFVRDITDRILNEQNLTRTKARMQRMIENLQGGVLVEDETRHIELVNPAFCQMFGIAAPPEALIGADCSQSAEQTKALFAEPEAFVQRIAALLQKRELALGDILHLQDGRVFRRDYIPTYNGQQYVGHLWHYHDVTEDFRMRQRWEQLLKLEALQKEIIQSFLQSDDLDHTLEKILTFAGQVMDVSRLYIFRFRGNVRLADNTHEWCAPGVTPDIKNLQGIPFEQITPSFFTLLARDGLIAAERPDLLPEDLHGMMEARKILSILILPVYSGEQLEGYVGCHETRYSRAWHPEEITTVRMIAESYARALEREEAQSMLIEARDTALHSAAMKSQFVANMSHEIRTPMTGVIGMLDLLRETPLDDEQREFAEEALQSAYRLINVINDILDFSKLESGRVVLQSEPLDLRAIASEVRTTLLPQMASKPIILDLDIASDVPVQVLGDGSRIRQVLMNLAGNAVKFTEKGQIVIRMRLLGKQPGMSWIRFEVRDTGIGIPLEYLARIFESFTQVDNTSTRRYGGTGLGLAISRQFVELMGGSLEVESEPGKGTTFHFSLNMPTHSESQSGDDVIFSDFNNVRAVVIDDDKTARYVLVQRLENMGIKVMALSEKDDLASFLSQCVDTGNGLDLAFIKQQKGTDTRMDLLREAVRRGAVQRIVSIIDELPSTGRLDWEITRLKRPVSQSDLYNVLVQTIAARKQGNTGLQPGQMTRHWQVLLAEDYALNVDLVKRGLEDLGIEVDAVGDGSALLEQLERKAYDLILMDVHMPIMDGVEATKRIRASSASYRNIPIVALTANALKDQQETYLEIGINAVVTKPYLLKDLRRTVLYWLQLAAKGAARLPEGA